MFGPLFMYYYLANPTSVGTVPAMPRGLNATATTTTVTVKWSPVSTANGYIAIIGISSFFGVVPLEDEDGKKLADDHRFGGANAQISTT
jgi:hypothetical protein